MMKTFPLGRIPSPVDTRDFRLSAHLPAPRVFPRRARLWEFHEHTLNQGNTNHCTGFSVAHWKISAPVKEVTTEKQAHQMYYNIKVAEGKPEQEDGATMRGIAKTLKALGMIDSYSFAGSMDEIKRYVLDYGPILAGTIWTEAMFEPDQFYAIQPKGEVLGGHAWLLRGYLGRGMYLGMSSWGEGWSERGNFRIHQDDLAYLLRTGGEFIACMQLAR